MLSNTLIKVTNSCGTPFKKHLAEMHWGTDMNPVQILFNSDLVIIVYNDRLPVVLAIFEKVNLFAQMPC